MKKYNNILVFYENYIKLEQQLRKGWIMCSVPANRLESVADHTLQLVMLASIISKELQLEFDMNRLTDMLLIHDIGEIVIGDISIVEDNFVSKKSKESASVKKILSFLSAESAKYYFDLWQEMEKKETNEAKFAFALDKIDAVIKSGIYEKKYNVSNLFNEFYSTQEERNTFENSTLKDFFEYLKEVYDNKEN